MVGGSFMQLALFPTSASLVRIDPACNAWRYYELTIQPDLFGGAALMRRWGRIGTQGRLRLDLFVDAGAAANQLARLSRQKLARGYAPRP
ncbi:WGR domain-containing protein [Acetobacter nitrogenifigens]|nr:WGR domain-containing protein [Acetobacter nitrogenifigens]